MIDMNPARVGRRKPFIRTVVVAIATIALTMGVTAVPANSATVSTLTVKIASATGIGAPGLHVKLGDTMKKTKADGTVTFKRVRSGKQTIVIRESKSLNGARWQRTEEIQVPKKSRASVRVRVSSLRLVKGEVTRHGKAVKGKTVTVFTDAVAWDGSSYARFQTKTDRNGRYAITVPKVPNYTFAKIAVDLGHGRLVYYGNTLLAADAKYPQLYRGPWNIANIKVASAPSKGAIVGKIVGRSGARVNAVKVAVESAVPANTLVRTVSTDAKGNFTIGGLAAGRYRVYAVTGTLRYRLTEDPTGYKPLSDAVTVKVGTKKVSVGRILIQPTGTVTVPVVPAATDSGEIAVALQDAQGGTLDRGEATIAAGATTAFATFKDVPSGRYRVALVGRNTASNYFDVAPGVVTSAPVLTSPATTTVSGVVSPMPTKFSLKVFPYAIDANGTRVDLWYTGDGAFSFPGMADGSYRLYVELNNDENNIARKRLTMATAKAVRVTVAGTQPVSGVRLSLVKAGSVTGKVVDRKTGGPVSGARVLATRVTATGSADLDRIWTHTAADGTYKVYGLAAGVKYKVAVVSNGVYQTSWNGSVTTAKKAKAVKVKAGKSTALKTIKLKR